MTARASAHLAREDSEATLKAEEGEDAQGSSNQNVMLAIVARVSAYVFELADRKDNTFAMSIHNFIQCTKESTESNPTV